MEDAMKSTDFMPVEDFFDEHFNAKQQHRKKMAALPFEEKIKIVVELQKIAIKAKQTAGKPIGSKKAWDI